MSQRYGFTQIDGDWVIELRKKELGRKSGSRELNDELLTMACGVVALGLSVVIAHVIVPKDLGRYQSFLSERRIAHRIVVLMPRESVVLERNLRRTCWPKTTPEYWVQKFRQDFLAAGESIVRYFYDNSDETAAETAANLAGAIGIPI